MWRRYFARDGIWISFWNAPKSNREKLKLFDFGVFQKFIQMPSRAKYLLHILFGAFQVPSRIGVGVLYLQVKFSNCTNFRLWDHIDKLPIYNFLIYELILFLSSIYPTLEWNWNVQVWKKVMCHWDSNLVPLYLHTISLYFI